MEKEKKKGKKKKKKKNAETKGTEQVPNLTSMKDNVCIHTKFWIWNGKGVGDGEKKGGPTRSRRGGVGWGGGKRIKRRGTIVRGDSQV